MLLGNDDYILIPSGWFIPISGMYITMSNDACPDVHAYHGAADDREALLCRCSSGYNLSKYPQDMLLPGGILLKKLNTQIAEQGNSILDRIRTQVHSAIFDDAK